MAMEFITHLLAVKIENFQSDRFSLGARDKTLIHAEIEDLGQGVFLRLQHHQLVAVLRQHAADLAVGIAHVANDACTADTALYTSRQQARSEEHTSELQSRGHLVCRPLREKKKASDDGGCW